ncbi:hypothetical protein LG943_05485 [Streptomonospora sp. S1-112]|uniref:Uncharacterized protein n=1 Tax=Streptomonospora mangrovi TaxID=2883123 RepID=A0A9X3NT96_9ACTN|nr:hypothetical protein [Streptomonospora mangrovi]MDA0563781.1 hypothetical protein [Streptomonospora mangrovi]
MSLLTRSLKRTATWTWVVEHDEGADGFAAGAPVVVNVARALGETGVFTVEDVETQWFQDGVGYLGIRTRLSGAAGLTPEDLVRRVWHTRPAAHEHAQPTILELRGTGYWIAADGTRRGEPDLFGVSFNVVDEDTMVELGVHHDIWAENDFAGRPHPEVHRRNAPRLEAVLLAVERALGVETEPDGATFLGTSFNYGVRAPSGANGRPLDVTERL